VENLTEDFQNPLLVECDVQDDASLDRCFATVRSSMGNLDALVHSVAGAKREELTGNYRDTSRDGYAMALDISAYSLVAITRRALPLMEGRHGSIIALSYLAAERAVPNYNVMGTAKAALEHAVRQLAYELGPLGVRVNCISAGPINTVSARGVGGFTRLLKHHEERAPLRRTVTIEEIGEAAVFLLSDMSSGVTGETLYVDGGYHITAV
jgi:enoyl-[acyl-carrier protein] reductase I